METIGDPNATTFVAALIILPFPIVWVFCYLMGKLSNKMGSELGMDTPVSFIPLRLWAMLRAKLQTTLARQIRRTLWGVLTAVSCIALILRIVPRSVTVYGAILAAWFVGLGIIQYFAFWGESKTQA